MWGFIMPGQDAQYIATPLTVLQGVADRTLEKLARLNLFNIHDMIFNLPFRYEDRTYIQALSAPHSEDTSCNVLLTINSGPIIKPKYVEFKTQDYEGTPCRLIFFHASEYFLRNFTAGSSLVAWGKVKTSFFNGTPSYQMSHPQVTFVTGQEIVLPNLMSPVYHLTAGLSQERMRELMETVLSILVRNPIEEVLPSELNPYNTSLTEALLITHNPPPRLNHGEVQRDALPSFQRLCFEELVAYQLCILELKARQSSKPAPAITFNEQMQQKFLDSLPFAPTKAQSRVFAEIMEDLKKDHAMNRLVHGDVGSGKTLVAAMSMLQVAANGMQAAMLAPTELLAKQHHAKLSALFAPVGFKVDLVIGSLKKKERETVFADAKSGEVKIFVGTHSLFQQAIHYQNLALAIVDEQHRFGVDQREALLNKSPAELAAHELLMTATPIPRSLQQTLQFNADVSTIDMLPAGRSPIVTAMIFQDRIQEVVARLRDHCSQGNQAYWVCPLVEDNEVLDATSAKERFKQLCHDLPEFKIGMLHAQMKEKEQNQVMEDFLNDEVTILVATTIVEVGVDVPNATVIVIENAERLGLAQLHQLRGRVGRGTKPSFCLLMHKGAPDPRTTPAPEIERYERGMQRLMVLRDTLNGFEIANEDLKMRGPGETFGTNQAGKENFRFADIERDSDIMPQAQFVARKIFGVNKKVTRELILRWFPEVLDLDNGANSEATRE